MTPTYKSRHSLEVNLRYARRQPDIAQPDIWAANNFRTGQHDAMIALEATGAEDGPPPNLYQRLFEIEREMIAAALSQEPTITAAARRLGLNHQTLCNMLKQRHKGLRASEPVRRRRAIVKQCARSGCKESLADHPDGGACRLCPCYRFYEAPPVQRIMPRLRTPRKHEGQWHREAL